MIVIDCNAAVNIALDTEKGKALAMLALKGERIIAPKLFYAELAYALVKYIKGGYLSHEEAQEKGMFALSLIDSFYEDQEQYTEVLSESIRLNHSSYDLFYVVLARRTAATLFTLDEKLVALCNREGVNCMQEVVF